MNCSIACIIGDGESPLPLGGTGICHRNIRPYTCLTSPRQIPFGSHLRRQESFAPHLTGALGGGAWPPRHSTASSSVQKPSSPHFSFAFLSRPIFESPKALFSSFILAIAQSWNNILATTPENSPGIEFFRSLQQQFKAPHATTMSCNGCRVLRKGCSDACVLRQCLRSIESVEAQGNATIFVAKFFGRAGMMSLISSVPESQRPATFKSLLYEACGRTINPVFGAVGLLCSGNWQLCEDAVETVMKGGFICSSPTGSSSDNQLMNSTRFRLGRGYIQAPAAVQIKRELEWSNNNTNTDNNTKTSRKRAKIEEFTAGSLSPSSACLDLELDSNEKDLVSLELTLALGRERKQPRRSSPCHSEADSDTTTDNLSFSGRRSPAALGLLH